jgi:hypothetical protein
MGLLDTIKKQQEPKQDTDQLTQKELELLLTLLKQATLKGEQVELFYNLAIKIQNQYTKITQTT